MSKLHPYRSVFAHGLKVWVFMLITFVPLALAEEYLPRWLFILLFFAYGLLVLMPVVFGVGPLGRRIGRRLNEDAIAQARAEREALGAVEANPSIERTCHGRQHEQIAARLRSA